MPLRKCHQGFEYVGKEKGEQKDKKGATSQVENSRRDQEQCHCRDHIPRSIVN
jgi:hypothetical protein